MAETLNKDTEITRIASRFREQLEDLHCPFVEEVDESWIIDLMFRPGEPRVRLLQWLFTKFDGAFADILDPRNVPSSCKMDSRIQRLLHVASFLGLCSSEEVDLIRGTCSIERQAAFFRQLLDILCACRQHSQGLPTFATPPRRIGSTSHESELMYQADCALVDKILENTSVEELFRPPKLFPPDIDKVIQGRLRNTQDGKHTRQFYSAQLESLEQSRKEYGIELGKQTEILEELKRKYAQPEQDPLKADKVNRSLSLVLSELAQQITSFNYFYENDLQPWCKKTSEAITKIGPEFKRVHSLLQQFITLMESISCIRTSHLHLCSEIRKRVEDLKRKTSTQMPEQKSERFQEYVDILEESIGRLENTMSTVVALPDESQLGVPSILLD